MQLGFCSDTDDERSQHQSDNILTRCQKFCFGRGDVFHACLVSSSILMFIKIGGNALAYCSHWVSLFLNQCLSSLPADRWSPVDAWWHVAEGGRTSDGPFQLLCPTATNNKAMAKSTGSKEFPCACGACRARSPNEVLLWPWGIFTKIGVGRVRSDMPLTDKGTDTLHATLSRGDGVYGEAIGTTCAFSTSLILMAQVGCYTHAVVICAIGCGETLRDGGSGVFAHGGEVPHVFGLWFHQKFLIKLAMSRRHMGRPSKTFVLSMISTAMCFRPKLVALESLFLQSSNRLKPIEVVTWTHTKIIPHAFERKRPAASDHAATMTLSIWWASLGHATKLSFARSKQASGLMPRYPYNG